MAGETDKARALLKFGTQALWGARFEEAEKALRDAEKLAAAAGDLRLRLRALARLLPALAYQGRLEEAREPVEAGLLSALQGNDPVAVLMVEACAQRLMPPGAKDLPRLVQELAANAAKHPQDVDVARALGTAASVANGFGAHKLAAQMLQGAVPVLEAAGAAPEAGTLLANLVDLAMTLEPKGDPARAELTLRRAVALQDKGYAPNHPERVGPMLTMGALQLRAHRYDEARASFRKALEIARAVEGPDGATPQMVMGALAELDERLLDAPAEGFVQKAAEAAAAQGPLAHGTALTLLCRHYFARGKPKAAEPHYRKLRELAAGLGENERLVLESEMGVPGKIYVLMNRERADLAEKLLLGEIETMERALPKGHEDITYRRYFAGNFYRMANRHKEALAQFERYVEGTRALGADGAGMLADGLARMLDAQLALGRPKDAERCAVEIEKLTGRKPRLDAALNEIERQLATVWQSFGLQQAPDAVGAALAGDPGAAVVLGMCYAAGQGVPRDYKRAQEWFERAAKAGHLHAAGMADDLRGGAQPQVGLDLIAQVADDWLKKLARK